jgi:hypothetical protein
MTVFNAGRDAKRTILNDVEPVIRKVFKGDLTLKSGRSLWDADEQLRVALWRREQGGAVGKAEAVVGVAEKADVEEPADDAEKPADDAEEPADDAEEPADDAEEPADDAEEAAFDVIEAHEQGDAAAGLHKAAPTMALVPLVERMMISNERLMIGSTVTLLAFDCSARFVSFSASSATMP